MTLRDFFYHTRKDRKGLLLLAALTLLVMGGLKLYYYLYTPSPYHGITKEEFLAKVQELQWANIDTVKLYKRNFNKLTDNDLEQLGFNSRQRSQIQQYKQSHGKFTSWEDLQKLSSFEYIAHQLTGIKFTTEKPRLELNSARFGTLLKLLKNKKDTKLVYNYRQKLGGFHTHSQLLELPKLRPTSWKKLKDCMLNKRSIRKLNLNSASFKALLKHPYINQKLAKKILRLKRDFLALDKELLKSHLEPDDYGRLLPYLP